MATFLVTTGNDVVNANDGVLSLREAIALAQASAGADTIKFAPETSGGGGVADNRVVLSSSLKIAAGNTVTIDGSTNNFGNNITIDGGYVGNPFTTPGFTMLEIASGATVKLADLTFSNGFERGAAGVAGISGTDGLKGNAGTGDTGNPGSNGNGGTPATSATSGGKMAVAGVQNAGNLTIERTEFVAMNAFGGAGAAGGEGGDGGAGGKGAPNKAGVGGRGGAGGPAGDGGNGSDGATAVGAIYNTGTLTLTDTTISLANAYGGAGGKGGNGGAGGAGGGGGSSTGSGNHGGYGGYGGNGGNAGLSGDGGDAASGILNAGTLLAGGKLAAFQGNEVAGTSAPASRGSGGGAGQGGSGDPRGDNGVAGTAGRTGVDGEDGAKAGTNHILGSTGGAVFVKNTFILEFLTNKVSEGGFIQFAVHRLGAATAAASVDWALSGANAADFKSGQALSGKASFAAGEKIKIFTVNTALDGLVEGNETFKVLLKNASTGNALGTFSSSTITIDDENHAPTNISLSKNTVDVTAPVGTVVGTLSGADPDGDALTFSMIFSSNGQFTINGGKVVLAKVLDPDRHSYSIFAQASDGQGGTFSKSLVIKLAGYIDGTGSGETLKGTEGRDKMFGFGGNDTIHGYGSADFIDGGTGADKMLGGGGGDTYIVDNGSDTVTEKSTDTGTDVVKSSVSFNLSSQHIEKLELTGSANIKGTGNSLSNGITGNSGNNTLNGLTGADILTGRGGADTFVFTTALGASNVDTVTDFGESDVFRLDNAVFTAFATTGAIASGAFKNLDTGSADGSDRILYDQDKGDLFYDRDGSGTAHKAVKFAEIANHASLNAGDFLII